MAGKRLGSSVEEHDKHMVAAQSAFDVAVTRLERALDTPASNCHDIWDDFQKAVVARAQVATHHAGSSSFKNKNDITARTERLKRLQPMMATACVLTRSDTRYDPTEAEGYVDPVTARAMVLDIEEPRHPVRAKYYEADDDDGGGRFEILELHGARGLGHATADHMRHAVAGLKELESTLKESRQCDSQYVMRVLDRVAQIDTHLSKSVKSEERKKLDAQLDKFREKIEAFGTQCIRRGRVELAKTPEDEDPMVARFRRLELDGPHRRTQRSRRRGR